MLDSYFQNANVGMTKDQYFEMCEMLGSEPKEDEIPVEYEDFNAEVQLMLLIYNKLRDDWDTMNGTYMGKSYIGLSEIFQIYEVEYSLRKLYLDWFNQVDGIRRKLYDAKKPASKTQ